MFARRDSKEERQGKVLKETFLLQSDLLSFLNLKLKKILIAQQLSWKNYQDDSALVWTEIKNPKASFEFLFYCIF